MKGHMHQAMEPEIKQWIHMPPADYFRIASGDMLVQCNVGFAVRTGI